MDIAWEVHLENQYGMPYFSILAGGLMEIPWEVHLENPYQMHVS